MNVFIVHAHHEPNSFNGAMTRLAQEVLAGVGHDVRVSDLYAMPFDPVSDRRNFTTVYDADYLKQQAEEGHAAKNAGFSPDIQAELDKLFWCDVLIFQFPLWWFGLPGILKGWVDRVFGLGVTYGGGRWYDNGMLAGRRAMAALTTGGPPSIYSAEGLNGDIDALLYPINHGIFRFVGFDVLPQFVAWGPARASDDERQGYLDAYRERLLTLEQTQPIAYPPLDDFEKGTWLRKSASNQTG